MTNEDRAMWDAAVAAHAEVPLDLWEALHLLARPHITQRWRDPEEYAMVAAIIRSWLAYQHVTPAEFPVPVAARAREWLVAGCITDLALSPDTDTTDAAAAGIALAHLQALWRAAGGTV